jgi:hypothetical protein
MTPTEMPDAVRDDVRDHWDNQKMLGWPLQERLDAAAEESYAAGRADERERIVAWLRSLAGDSDHAVSAGWRHAADCIERGDHRDA